MKDFVRQCEAHLAKYHGHASSFFMTFMVVAVCGFISPSLLLAAEIESSVANPVPALREYNMEKPKIVQNYGVAPKETVTSSSPKMIGNPGVFSSSSQEKIIQYRNARIQKIITALVALEKSSADLRAELQKIQTSSASSTKAINMGQVEKQINAILNQFKKTNFNSEFVRLKSELKVEQSKRVNVEKKEMQRIEKMRPIPPNATSSSQTIEKRDMRRMSDLKQIQTALELFYTDQAAYPAGTEVVLGQGDYACLNVEGFKQAGCQNAYMGKIPSDPVPGYQYVYAKINNYYTVTAKLEGKINGLSGAIVLNPSGIKQK